MNYVLKIFDLIIIKDNLYIEYSIKAGKIIFAKGGKVASSVWKQIRKLKDDINRKYMILVPFSSIEVFQEFLIKREYQNIHKLRENYTKNYFKILLEHWSVKLE